MLKPRKEPIVIPNRKEDRLTIAKFLIDLFDIERLGKYDQLKALGRKFDLSPNTIQSTLFAYNLIGLGERSAIRIIETVCAYEFSVEQYEAFSKLNWWQIVNTSVWVRGGESALNSFNGEAAYILNQKIEAAPPAGLSKAKVISNEYPVGTEVLVTCIDGGVIVKITIPN